MSVTEQTQSPGGSADLAALYRTLVHECGDGLVLLDQDKTISYANPAAQKLLGLEAETGGDIAFRFPVSGRRREVAEFVTPGGQFRMLDLSVRPLSTFGGDGYVVAVRRFNPQVR